MYYFYIDYVTYWRSVWIFVMGADIVNAALIVSVQIIWRVSPTSYLLEHTPLDIHEQTIYEEEKFEEIEFTTRTHPELY